MAKQEVQVTRTEVATLRMMTEGGHTAISPDSGYGHLGRPFMVGDRSDRQATLETLYDFFINNVPDPDIALAQDPNFDEKLRQHPDVHAAARLRELTVASMPAHVEPSKAKNIDRRFAQDVADYVDEVLSELPNRVEFYRQMQNAVLMGGQGIELNWAKINGVERPVQYFPVHKTRFIFDRLGNMALLTRENPVWGVYLRQNPQAYIPKLHKKGMLGIYAPSGKFIYHKYMSEGGPWYRPADEGYVYWGRGEDTNLYIPVTFDQFVLRFRMKWLERHGIPTAVLYYPDSEGVSSQLTEILDSIRGEATITMPRPTGADNENAFYKLEFQDPPTGGVDAFTNFSDGWTKPRIEKILLGGANLLEVGDKGSYGATVGQRDAGSDIIFRYDAANIDETLNSQVVPDIARARWPGLPDAYLPKHKLAPKEELDQEVRLNNLRLTAEMVPVRTQDIYDAANLDRPKTKDDDEGIEEDEETVFLGQQQADPFSMLEDELPPGQNPPGGAPGQRGAAQTRPQRHAPTASGKQRPRSPIGKSRPKK